MEKVGDHIAVVGNDPTILVNPNLMFLLGSHARIVVQMLADRTVDTAPRILMIMECQDKNRKRERNEQNEKDSLAGRIMKQNHWGFPQTPLNSGK